MGQYVFNLRDLEGLSLDSPENSVYTIGEQFADFVGKQGSH